jgi:hypothetical protein
MAAKKSTPTPKPTPKPAPQYGLNKFLSDTGKNIEQAAKDYNKFNQEKIWRPLGEAGIGVSNFFASRPNPVKPTPTMIPSNYGVGAGRTATGATNMIGAGTPISKIVTPTGNVGRTTGTGGTGGGNQQRPLSELLRVPGIEDIYSPVTQFLGEQETAANRRYNTNAANIKNIFSALTGLTAQDSARITKQFKDSLTASKANLAARTAEARQGAAAGAAQAAVTGAERGGGDAMVASPVQQAVDESIGRSNEYATTWQALQAANEQQAQADISARGAGYGQQQVGAIQQLAQGLEDRLLEIGGNTAQVQSDIAQAKFAQETNIAQANYAEALASQRAAAAAAAKANTPAKQTALEKVRESLEPGQFDAIAAQLNSAYARAYAGANPAGYTGAGKEPSVAAVMAEWAIKGNKNLIAQARTIAETIYGK